MTQCGTGRAGTGPGELGPDRESWDRTGRVGTGPGELGPDRESWDRTGRAGTAIDLIE